MCYLLRIPAAATADWIQSQQMLQQLEDVTTPQPASNVAPHGSGADSGIVKQMPTQAEFKVPQNQSEHKQIVAKLVEGGSTPSEAELVIASRKTAFNKAIREYKRDLGQIPGPRKGLRQSGSKTSKHVTQNSTQDGI